MHVKGMHVKISKHIKTCVIYLTKKTTYILYKHMHGVQ